MEENVTICINFLAALVGSFFAHLSHKLHNHGIQCFETIANNPSGKKAYVLTFYNSFCSVLKYHFQIITGVK
jgi:hypothetical protein